ncbi:MAG: glutathione S-transferase [Planktotalea sp.]|jgi:glutathione S-transferase|uniref:glutathione S-transferase n=1 Tax=Planktotalea sp. TaxID=2029877 RepID=UPI0001839C3D|nr:glutathione S-transferase [Planktotalea sp.]EDZ43017.1 rhodanese domain protein [Rhodobacteraceae bacterium HTCC2083]MDG1075414.1 glutathione S-transferase [Planktotalea sp.]MDG1084981.1 glutathione S-transferase [Planktotalea sp.]HCW84311.1 glutathione S-transferase [Paracoccaceae bacterium]
MSDDLPILYSFRRCPYAIRARLAVATSGVRVEFREISLKEKHPAFLQVSSSGTVPCLVADGGVIDESLDIMIWALTRNDPQGWLDMPEVGWRLIEQFDGPFKDALDRTKYAVRHPELDPLEQRAIAHRQLTDLNASIGEWVFDRPTLADFAILPFVRQFAFIDKTLFDAQPWDRLQAWLARFLSSSAFQDVMGKHAFWQTDDVAIYFP